MNKLLLPLLAFSFSMAQDQQAIVAAFDNAAQEFDIPADVLKGIAFAETRWQHLTWAAGDTASSCTGMPRPYGIMGLWDNDFFGHSLRRAAALLRRKPEELKADIELNMRGAAAVLKQLHDSLPLPEGTSTSDIESWRNAIAAYCGIPQVELAQQHALDIYTQMSKGYHQFHISWDARRVNLDAIRTAVARIQANAAASRPADRLQKTASQPDYPLAKWVSAYSGHWYENGWDPTYGKSFVVIHDMEGYYLSVISYFQLECQVMDATGNCIGRASAHYLVNSKNDGATDAPAGEITQMVEERNAAWHVRCWNRLMFGIEHEGFVSNPAWFTDDMYKSSARLTAYLCAKYGIPKDRNHIIGHDQHLDANWSSWFTTNYTSHNSSWDPACNTHTDPGSYWNWTYYMSLVTGDTLPPKIVSVSPRPNDTSQLAYVSVRVQFSTLMDTAATNLAFSIIPTVSGTLSWSSDLRTVTFQPASLLSFGTKFTVKIDSTAKRMVFNTPLDGNGDGIGGDSYEFSFSTEQPYTTAPFIVHSYPAPAAQDIPGLADFYIEFNKPVQAATVPSRILLFDSADTNIPLSHLKVDSINDHGAISFSSSQLQRHSRYRLTLLAGLKDLYGNQSMSDSILSFTTSPDSVAQGIVFDPFDYDARGWIQPNLNAGTLFSDSASTKFIFTGEKYKSSAKAGKLTYRFTRSTGGIIVLQVDGTPTFDSYTSFGIWICGDESYNQIDLTFQPQNQTIPFGTISWRGWKFLQVPLAPVSGPYKKFSSIVVRQQPEGATSGALYFDDMQVNAIVTNTREITLPMIPARISLGQNFPNPFNPSTVISFEIPKESRVRVGVYNTLGQQVRVLVNEVKPPGMHHVQFDASDLPSGVYFYRLEAGLTIETKKMLLIR